MDSYSQSLLVRLLVRRFLQSVRECLAPLSSKSVLDVGCAAGELAGLLFWQQDRRPTALSNLIRYHGIDSCARQIENAREKRGDYGSFSAASVYELPFCDESFDTVLACEILEHLDAPEITIREIARVAKRYALVSVPWEPVWRICNCVRGAYLSHWGNTPGHVQHFTRAAIRSLVSSRFTIVNELHPFPWTVLLLEKRA